MALAVALTALGLMAPAPAPAGPALDGPKYQVSLLTGALPPSSRPVSAETVEMTKANGKRYRCHLPNADGSPNAAQLGAQQSTASVASYLNPIKGTCFYRLEGWWTYEFCYLKSLRQFHQEKAQGAAAGKPDATTVTQDYTLGKWWEPPKAAGGAAAAAAAAVGTAGDEADGGAADGGAATSANSNMELREDAKTRKKYWSQEYGNGTLCDMTGRPRLTEVRLQCSPGEPSHLSSIEEVSTCRYLVHFSSNLLCKHPGFVADEHRDVTQVSGHRTQRMDPGGQEPQRARLSPHSLLDIGWAPQRASHH